MIILSFLTLSAWASETCQFRKNITQVYSLSGSITMALKSVGLTKDPKLKGVSIFHPLDKNEFKGQFLPGGVYLSRESAKKMEGGLVFFDESRELSKFFQMMSVRKEEIKTRNLTPLEVNELVIQKISQITDGCEQKLRALSLTGKQLANEILRSIPPQFSAVFFLGALKKKSAPEMIMVNDGILKWLMEKKKIKTYPTQLSYLPWSSKMMNELSPSTYHIGLKDSGASLFYDLEKIEEKRLNLHYPGALIPGISQLEAWLYFFQSISRKNL